MLLHRGGEDTPGWKAILTHVVEMGGSIKLTPRLAQMVEVVRHCHNQCHDEQRWARAPDAMSGSEEVRTYHHESWRSGESVNVSRCSVADISD